MWLLDPVGDLRSPAVWGPGDARTARANNGKEGRAMIEGRTPGSEAVPHRLATGSRREFLLRGGGGFGALALAYLLEQDGALLADGSARLQRSPLAVPRGIGKPRSRRWPPSGRMFPHGAKRRSFCSWTAGPATWTCLIPSRW